MSELNDGEEIPVARDEFDNYFQSGIKNIQDYLKSKRKQQRAKVRFNRPENFSNSAQKQDPRYSLTPEEIEWFYPVSKKVSDWTYSGETTASAVEADKIFLESILPLKYPEDSYFENEELPYLLSIDTPLRYPPIYFIRKLKNFFIIFYK